MSDKETAIEMLEAIAHWMRISKFDYDEESLEYILNDVKRHYKKYLDEKINIPIIPRK